MLNLKGKNMFCIIPMMRCLSVAMLSLCILIKKQAEKFVYVIIFYKFAGKRVNYDSGLHFHSTTAWYYSILLGSMEVSSMFAVLPEKKLMPAMMEQEYRSFSLPGVKDRLF